MSDDLVKRLREPGVGSARWVLVERPLLVAAADLIEAQAKRIAQLEARLSNLLGCAERHIFSDECKVQRDEARAALGGKDE